MKALIRQLCEACIRLAVVAQSATLPNANGNGTTQPKRTGPSAQAAVELLLNAKKSAGRRPQYLTSLRRYLTAFSIFISPETPLSDVAVTDLERWFASRNEAPASRASNAGRLSALFSYGIRQGWLESNPVQKLERVSIDRPPPKIFTVEDCRRILTACKKHSPALLPGVVLGLFCGIRPHELHRMAWAAVNRESGKLTVDAAASKVRRRRIVDIPPVVWDWMQPGAGPLLPSNSTVRRERRRLCRLLRLEWPQDAIRHTAASMMLARDKDAAAVALQLGNSPRILQTHYAELVTEADAEAFWSMHP